MRYLLLFTTFILSTCLSAMQPAALRELSKEEQTNQWLAKVEELIELLGTLDPAQETQESLNLNSVAKAMAIVQSLSSNANKKIQKCSASLLESTIQALEDGLTLGNLKKKDLNHFINVVLDSAKVVATDIQNLQEEKRHCLFNQLLSLSQTALTLKIDAFSYFCKDDTEFSIKRVDLAAMYLTQCLGTVTRYEGTLRTESIERLSYICDFMVNLSSRLSCRSETLAKTYALHELKRFVTVLRYTLEDCTEEDTICPSFVDPVQAAPHDAESRELIGAKYPQLMVNLKDLDTLIDDLL